MSLLDMIRRKVNQQSAQGMSPSPSLSPPTPPTLRDRQNDEDAWSEVTSSEGGLHTHESLEEDMAQLLPYMPSLLGEDLPPCGLFVQVAYENVNTRLRKRWIYFRGQKSVSNVCQVVKDDLANQSILFPPSSRPSGPHGKSVQRTPWRRETVFFYEVRWIDYFLREAHAPEPMTESELVGRANQPTIPKELGLQCHRQDVLGLWHAWHAKKHAYSPPMPSVHAESGLKASSSGVWKNANGEIGDSGASIIASSGATVIVPAKETEEDIQRELRTESNSCSQERRD